MSESLVYMITKNIPDLTKIEKNIYIRVISFALSSDDSTNSIQSLYHDSVTYSEDNTDLEAYTMIAQVQNSIFLVLYRTYS